MNARTLRFVAGCGATLAVLHAVACGNDDSAPLEIEASDASSSRPDGAQGDAEGGAMRPPCSPTSCQGHGVCTDRAEGGACACDEGFVGFDCESRGPDYGRRFKIAEDLADPDVLKLADDRFVLSGTGPGNVFQLYEPSDLITWTKGKTYSPSEKDDAADTASHGRRTS